MAETIWVRPFKKSLQKEPLCRVCHSDDANDTIPIVVGAVLAAMILVVMVSYFVVRMRANKK